MQNNTINWWLIAPFSEIKPSYQYIYNEYQYLIFQGRKIYRRKISRQNNTINFGNWEEYPCEPK